MLDFTLTYVQLSAFLLLTRQSHIVAQGIKSTDPFSAAAGVATAASKIASPHPDTLESSTSSTIIQSTQPSNRPIPSLLLCEAARRSMRRKKNETKRFSGL